MILHESNSHRHTLIVGDTIQPIGEYQSGSLFVGILSDISPTIYLTPAKIEALIKHLQKVLQNASK